MRPKKGKNYGIELSLEKNLDNHFYLLFSNALYQSKYTASDGIERNTRLNGNFISNIVAGKEFVYAEGRRTLGINIRAVYAGDTLEPWELQWGCKARSDK